MVACGLWSASRRLVAVVVDDDGRASPAIAATLDDDARWGLLERIDAVHGLDCELVIPQEMARADSIGQLALLRGISVWIAPHRIIDPIRTAAAMATGPPACTAAMIARLAIIPTWRAHLRRIGPAIDRRQLPLF